MPLEFTEWDDDLEAQPSSAHSGSPPRKHTGVGVLEPDESPEKHSVAIPSDSLLRIMAWLILVALAAGIVFQLLFRFRQ
jgi:hypothetical protein